MTHQMTSPVIANMYTSVCVPQSVNIEYTCSDFYSPVAQSWAGFQKCTVSLGITYNVVLYVCLFACAYNGTYIYSESWHYLRVHTVYSESWYYLVS